MRITPGVLQLTAILLAPIAALAGVWLSPYLAARIDRKRWLRDRRAAAYVAAIEAAEMIRVGTLVEASTTKLEEIHQGASSPASSDQMPNLNAIRQELQRQVIEPLTPLIRAESELSIFGDEAAFKAIRRLVSALMALRASSAEADAAKDARDKEVYEAETELINVCRRSFSLRPLQF